MHLNLFGEIMNQKQTKKLRKALSQMTEMGEVPTTRITKQHQNSIGVLTNYKILFNVTRNKWKRAKEFYNKHSRNVRSTFLKDLCQEDTVGTKVQEAKEK